MRKWTYLVAALLMTGATTTFTGCIDNDEPAGIENLRGAKAELLKAKAAVELANAEMIKAETAGQLLLNKAQELANSRFEIETELSKLNNELKKLEVERAQATTSQAKAEAEAAIAKANQEKAGWENKMKLEAEQFKADMLDAQKATAMAQDSYDRAIKAIEAGKLLLSDGEKAVIDLAQQRLVAAANAYKAANNDVKAAANLLDIALQGKEVTINKADLEAQIEKAQLAVTAAELNIQEINDVLAKNISTFEGWEKEVADLEVKKAEQDTIIAQANIDMVKKTQSAEYKAAAKAETDAAAAELAAKNKYNDANNAVDKKFTKFSKSVAENLAVTTGLNNAAAAMGTAAPTDYAAGKFTNAGGTYSQANYDDDAVNTNAELAETEVAGWIKLVDKATEGINLEDIAWSTREIEAKKADKAAAATAYATSFNAWETARDNFVNNAIPSMPAALTTVKAAIQAWNGLTIAQKKDEANVNILGSALNAYWIAADKNVLKSNKTITNALGVTKELSEWMLTGASYFRTTVAPELGIITYSGGTITGAVDIDTANEGFLTATVTGTGMNLLDKLKAASLEAFGDKMYMVSPTQPRLTAPTDAEVAQAAQNILAGTFTAAQYGKLGAKIASAQLVTKLQNILDQKDTYIALRADLVAQQTKLKAEIAANAAKVAALKTAWDDAKNVTKAAGKAKTALTAEITKTINAATETKAVYVAIINVIKAEMAAIAGGQTTVAGVVAALKTQLVNAKIALAAAQANVKKAETALAQYIAGNYDKNYEINNLTTALKVAQDAQAAAQKVYEAALADVNNVIATLTK